MFPSYDVDCQIMAGPGDQHVLGSEAERMDVIAASPFGRALRILGKMIMLTLRKGVDFMPY